MDSILVLKKVYPSFADICDDFEEIANHLARQPKSSSNSQDLVNTLEALREEIIRYLETAKLTEK